MLISLDYDKTYTRDPALWDAFIASAEAARHQVICLTMRHPHERISMPCPVIYTKRMAKKPYAEALGLSVDVWIDDTPGWIFTDAI